MILYAVLLGGGDNYFTMGLGRDLAVITISSNRLWIFTFFISSKQRFRRIEFSIQY